VAALTLLAAAIRFFYIGHQASGSTEGNTALLVQANRRGMLGLIPADRVDPPLYYMAAWVWVRIFGTRSRAEIAVGPGRSADGTVAYAAAAKLVSDGDRRRRCLRCRQRDGSRDRWGGEPGC